MTIWSLLMTIPTVISGFFGMNVDLPLAKVEGGWIIISVITAVLLWRCGNLFGINFNKDNSYISQKDD